jgi:hypothetical protein
VRPTSNVAVASVRIAMKLYPDFVQHRKITRDMDRGKLLARRPGLSRTHDVIVAATLLAFLVADIVTRATVSNEIADSNVDRQGYVAFVIDVVATLGLSIGLAWLLFSSRPRADDKGARS